MSANSLPNPAAVWHSLEVDKTLQQLDSDRWLKLKYNSGCRNMANELKAAGRSP